MSSFHDINSGISPRICFRISARDLDDLYTSRTGEGNDMHMEGTGQPAFSPSLYQPDDGVVY